MICEVMVFRRQQEANKVRLFQLIALRDFVAKSQRKRTQENPRRFRVEDTELRVVVKRGKLYRQKTPDICKKSLGYSAEN